MDDLKRMNLMFIIYTTYIHNKYYHIFIVDVDEEG